jgi:small subunit ribosomal protein S4e
MEAAGSKLCKIISKRQLGKSRFQLNMHDGRNIMVQESAKYATGGTLRISVPKQEVAEYYPLKAGARCLVYKGVHSGKVATLSELIEREASAATDAMLKTGDGSQFITRKDYLFVVGPEFS